VACAQHELPTAPGIASTRNGRFEFRFHASGIHEEQKTLPHPRQILRQRLPTLSSLKSSLLFYPLRRQETGAGPIHSKKAFVSSVLTAVDAATGKVLESVPVGPKPRFLTVGRGSVWSLNQGDGTVSRVDERNRKVIATIQVGIPGAGGDIGYGADSVWPTVLAIPLTQIDARTNQIVRQWVGSGGDSLRFGFDSLWLTDYKKGLLSRIPIPQLSKH
jgi:YVTN family beta-propeller protein